MEQFVDVVSFDVAAGHGGAGGITFRKEAYVPMGGPDGGNGGNGGNVVILVDARINSFGKIKSRRIFKASDGLPGTARLSDGKNGEDNIIKVPVGTEVYDDSDNSLLTDLTNDGDIYILARGGKGGKGNKFYATATNQAPDYAQHGMPGEELRVRLEVKLIADIGLVGFPNAGKSSLLARLTRANPKIAAYPFTTLTPNLGVCYLDADRSIVIADIPGIIEGAHQGSGLGLTFLRHIERTGALAFILDISSESPFSEYQKLFAELALYSEVLIQKKSIIILNKTDLLDEEEIEKRVGIFMEQLRATKKTDLPEIFSISVFSTADSDIKSVATAFYKASLKTADDLSKDSIKRNLETIKTSSQSKRVFGPIVSKRLGYSLGIDVTPSKTCSYDCLYCQIGTKKGSDEEKTSIEIANFYSVDEIIFELRLALQTHKKIDYITLSGAGEPTLFSDIKRLIAEIKSVTNIPVCIITNGSMLYKQEIRSSILEADLIIPSLDAGNAVTFELINKPHKGINFDKMVEGLIALRRVFKGVIWLEIFILQGINDSIEEIKSIASIAKKISANEVQLLTATRKTAYEEAKAVSQATLLELAKYFHGNVSVPQYSSSINSDEKNTQVSEFDILNILIRHSSNAQALADGLKCDLTHIKELLQILLRNKEIYACEQNGDVSYSVALER